MEPPKRSDYPSLLDYKVALLSYNKWAAKANGGAKPEPPAPVQHGAQEPAQRQRSARPVAPPHAGPGYFASGLRLGDDVSVVTDRVGKHKVSIAKGFLSGTEIEIPDRESDVLSVRDGVVDCAGPGLPLIRRMGGKQMLLPWLLQQFPRNVGTYVEPFGGSFKVLLGKTWRDRIEVINDLDGDIVHFYRCVQKNPDALAEYINTAFPFAHEAIILGLRGELGDKKLTGIERAAAFYICSRTAFNAKISTSLGSYASSPVVPMSISADAERFRICWERLRGVDIRSTSFERVLESMIKPNPRGLFVYMDPPYWDTAGYEGFGDLKADGFTWEHHRQLFEYCCAIDKIGGRFIQTNSDSEELRQLYGSNKRFRIQRRLVYYKVSGKSEARRATGEFIISNYDLDTLQIPQGDEVKLED